MISPLMHIALDSESNSQTCIHNLLHRGKLKVMIFQSLKVIFMHCSLAKVLLKHAPSRGIKTFFEVHAPVAGTPRRNTVFQHSF